MGALYGRPDQHCEPVLDIGLGPRRSLHLRPVGWPARRTWVLRAFITVLVPALLAAAPAPAGANPRANYIVQRRPGAWDAQGRAAVRAAGGRVTGDVRIIHALAARLPAR